LKHDVDIPDQAAGQAVGGCRQYKRYRLLSEPASAWHRLALFNSNTLMMLWWLMKGCIGQRFATSAMLLFGLQNLCM